MDTRSNTMLHFRGFSPLSIVRHRFTRIYADIFEFDIVDFYHLR